MTFNHRISKEIANKFKDQFSRINEGQRPKICTIDSLAHQIVGSNQKNIDNSKELKKLKELLNQNKSNMMSSMKIN